MSCGLEFIGPSPESIAQLGDKARAKAIAKSAGCPVIPGPEGIVESVEAAVAETKKMGYPIFIKAVAGGGGRGIRICYEEREFRKQFMAARAEAEASFGNPDVYLEKMIVNPRHVEVQVVGDKMGNYIHLGERDCTIQRRRQKLIEEAPSPFLTPRLRKKMGQAAIDIMRKAGYYSVGTVEFLVDESHNFYFMEVNTRIQVEHTVSEELTGVDLVKEQIAIARGEELSVRQRDVHFEGHVIQFRINAENPAHHFTPSPGQLEYYLPPGGPHVRVDSACYSGYKIPPHYDSMIAKLIVKGKNRQEAIERGRRALREFHIGGVHSTLPFHQYMLQDRAFLEGTGYNLHYIDKLIENQCTFQL